MKHNQSANKKEMYGMKMSINKLKNEKMIETK